MTTTTNSTPSRSNAQRKAPQETAHMNVLGRDGSDLEITCASENDKSSSTTPSSPRRSSESTGNVKSSPRAVDSQPRPRSPPSSPPIANNSNSEASLSSSKKHWLSKMVWGRKKNDEENDDANSRYQSLEAPLGDGRFSGPLNATSSSIADNDTVSLTPTVEDQLRQDCPFFYQGMEDPSPRRGGLQQLSAALDRVPRVLSSRDGARFHAKYEQLNQELVRDEPEDDLFLDEYTGNEAVSEFQSDTSRNVVDVQHSSLCYEQNGRLLMRLPRDQVRLIMDQDLEPGIVSVEQWREVDKTQLDSPTNGELSCGPPLRYVMTVPDDLYRRVVAEMSYAMLPPYWGMFRCCNESERADIRLALLILAVTLILMFITTMEWPTE